jgi:hypothetical protein
MSKSTKSAKSAVAATPAKAPKATKPERNPLPVATPAPAPQAPAKATPAPKVHVPTTTPQPPRSGEVEIMAQAAALGITVQARPGTAKTAVARGWRDGYDVIAPDGTAQFVLRLKAVRPTVAALATSLGLELPAAAPKATKRAPKAPATPDQAPVASLANAPVGVMVDAPATVAERPATRTRGKAPKTRKAA